MWFGVGVKTSILRAVSDRIFFFVHGAMSGGGHLKCDGYVNYLHAPMGITSAESQKSYFLITVDFLGRLGLV